MHLAGVRLARTILVATLLAGTTLTFSPSEALAQRRGGNEPKVDESAEQNTLNVRVGETKTIRAQNIKQYSEGPGGIADIKVTPEGDKFVVTGLKQGSTSLLLIRDDRSQVLYTINIFAQDPGIVEKELRQLLEPYMGVRLRTIGTRLFIEGGVATKDDEARIKQIAELYSGQVESLVTVGAGSIDRKINIRIDLFFVQFNDNRGYSFGITWPSRIGGVQDPNVIESRIGYDLITKTPTANATIVNHPLPGLDMAANAGWAKVLKQATLITTNGNEATFGNGGQEYFLISSGLQPKLESIPFGTNVTVQPRFDPRTRNLELKVTADISDLVPPRSSATNIPGKQTAQVSTLVFLKLGESLIISGIRSSSRRHGISGVPYLSEIPVLGLLFGSHSDAEEEIEGAVFIIPSVVESVPKSSYDMVKAAMEQYDDYSGDLDDVDPYPKDPPDYGRNGAGVRKRAPSKSR
jgi:pilus assembly protein CpaC